MDAFIKTLYGWSGKSVGPIRKRLAGFFLSWILTLGGWTLQHGLIDLESVLQSDLFWKCSGAKLSCASRSWHLLKGAQAGRWGDGECDNCLQLVNGCVGKSTGNHGFYHQNLGVSCKFSHDPILWTRASLVSMPVEIKSLGSSWQVPSLRRAYLEGRYLVTLLTTRWCPHNYIYK